MTRTMIAAASCAAALFGLTTAALATAARSGDLCVGAGHGCYPTIQSAVDAARDGDAIAVRPGVYQGGVVIDKSLRLVGSGAARTVIRGGGPVLTIGVEGAAAEPTVSISGLTITGGVNTGDGTVAFGGGILVPRGAAGGTGATVTVSDSAIVGNRAAPTIAAPIGPPCPGGPCGFARGDGGGIWNAGNLTLRRTTVTGNLAGGAVASDAHGGGIWSAGVATLTIRASALVGNTTSVAPPNGRFAVGGGVHIQDGGGLEIADSLIGGNSVSLTSALPGGIEMIANGGGVHIGDCSEVTIERTHIDGNTVRIDDVNGQPSGFDAGMIEGVSTLVLKDSTVDGNRVIARVAATDDNGGSGGALELDGAAVLENVRVTGNSTTVSATGNAAAYGALQVFGQGGTVVIRDSTISGNVLRSSSVEGDATARGAGVVNNGLLELRSVRVIGNAARATGPSGFAQGGGIWNGLVFVPPPVQLRLVDTLVTKNSVESSGGLAALGGGVYTTFPIEAFGSRIAANRPDDCFGC
jgi:F-box protein 11